MAEVITWDLCVFRVEDRRTPATVFVVRRGPEVDAFLAELDAGALDAALARALRRRRPRRLRNRPRGAARRGVSVGIEHEYRIVDPTGGQVDARTVLHDLGLDGVRADPSDPNAYRCPWGGVVTCDGPEVEVATAPFRAEPGVVDRVVAQAADGRAVLEALLPAGHVLEGFSTHVSVSMPRHGDDRLARRYASTFAPALMLLLDGPASPGLLVRPRPGRLELCGEHADGDVLRAAVAFAVGSVRAARRPRRVRRLAVRASVVPAMERYGWYVDRGAFGVDLYDGGRSATLQRRRGPVTAGRHLLEAWAVARPWLLRLAGPEDAAAADRVIHGDDQLPVERSYPGAASYS